jgi:hypothetical protein
MRTAASQVGAGSGLDIHFFVKCLVMLAMYAFGRSAGGGGGGPNGGVEGKVDAMLVRWGLGDSNKLANVRKHLHNK